MLTHRAETILGGIPADWRRTLLRSLLSENMGGDWGDDDGDVAVRVLRSTNFDSRGTLNLETAAVRFFPTKKAATLSLQKNDILLERSGGGPSQPVGRIGVISESLENYWFSNFVQVLRPEPTSINPDFLAWLLLRLHQSGVVERLQHQTTQMRNLDFRDYLRVYLPVPIDTDEQRIIAELLRVVTDALKLADQKLLAARRVKTSLSQNLLTGGIPGRHQEFRAEKVLRHEFAVPRVWHFEPLKLSITSLEYGTNQPSNDAKRGLPVVAIPQVIAPRFRLGECPYTELSKAEADSLRLAKGPTFC